MNTWIAIFLAVGITTFAYTKLNRRAGYGNTKSIIPSLIAIFFIVLIVVYTLLRFVLNFS